MNRRRGVEVFEVVSRSPRLGYARRSSTEGRIKRPSRWKQRPAMDQRLSATLLNEATLLHDSRTETDQRLSNPALTKRKTAVQRLLKSDARQTQP